MTTPTPSTSALIPAFVNAAAGSAAGVERALAECGRFDVHRVTPAELEPAIRAAIADGASRILVAGGDGTLASAASIVAGTPVELAVLPAGTLNHFARDLGIPVEPDAAATCAAGSVVRTVDVASVNGRIFLNTSSVGAYVRFVRHRTALETRLGYAGASAIAFLRVFATLRSVRVELDLEGSRRVYRTPFVFIGVDERETKLPLAGGRLPGGRRGLHVIVPRARTRSGLARLALKGLLRGVRAAESAFELDSDIVDRCRIVMPRHRGNVAVDGEVVPMLAPLDYRLERDALRVVVQRSDDAGRE